MSDAKRLAAGLATSDHKPSHIALMGRLLKLSNLVMRPFFFIFADLYSLNPNELRVLMTLAPMGEAAAHEIAKATGMHPMNVSRAVASLTRAGRVTARPDNDNDGRRKILSLTPKGRELNEALLPHVRHMADLLFETMSPLETEFFAKLLAKLVEQMDEVVLSDRMMINPIASTGTTETARAGSDEKSRRRVRRSAS